MSFYSRMGKGEEFVSQTQALLAQAASRGTSPVLTQAAIASQAAAAAALQQQLDALKAQQNAAEADSAAARINAGLDPDTGLPIDTGHSPLLYIGLGVGALVLVGAVVFATRRKSAISGYRRRRRRR